MKYRRISTVVEAWQNVTGAPYPEWLMKMGVGEAGSTLKIDTPRQYFEVQPGYWLVREDHLHFSAWNPRMFVECFESVK